MKQNDNFIVKNSDANEAQEIIITALLDSMVEEPEKNIVRYEDDFYTIFEVAGLTQDAFIYASIYVDQLVG